MDTEWRTNVRPGYRTKVVKIGNATVTIHRPILLEAEQAKREEAVRQALKGFYTK